MDSYNFESLYAKKDLKDKKKYDEKQNLEDKLAFDKYEKKDKVNMVSAICACYLVLSLQQQVILSRLWPLEISSIKFSIRIL